MDYLCQELNIPKKQISETTTKNRFKCIAHKSFLKNLIKAKKLSNFQVYPQAIDEWPQQKDLGCNWEQVYIVVSDLLKFYNSYRKVQAFVVVLGVQKN